MIEKAAAAKLFIVLVIVGLQNSMSLSVLRLYSAVCQPLCRHRAKLKKRQNSGVSAEVVRAQTAPKPKGWEILPMFRIGLRTCSGSQTIMPRFGGFGCYRPGAL